MQGNLARIAEEVYDRYVAAAATERGIRAQLRQAHLSEKDVAALMANMKEVTEDVKRLREEAQKASREAAARRVQELENAKHAKALAAIESEPLRPAAVETTTSTTTTTTRRSRSRSRSANSRPRSRSRSVNSQATVPIEGGARKRMTRRKSRNHGRRH